MLTEQLTGWDFLIIGLTVLFVEFVVKLIFKDEKYKLVWKLSPIVIDAIVYVVIALISKGTWYTALIHGIAAGLAAMGSYDVILKTLRVPETERSKIIYQCFGPEHRLLFRPEDMVVNDMPGLPFPEFFPHLRFENAKITRCEYLGKEYLVTAQYEGFTIKVYTVYKPASDTITAGIRMTKILEFNDGKLIRH